MSLLDLLAYIDTALDSNPSVVIDDALLRSTLGFGDDFKLTREVANRSCSLIVELRPRMGAATEAFYNDETREEIVCYIIVARSDAAYRAAMVALSQRVMDERNGETAEHRIYTHPHDGREQPEPLVMPVRPFRERPA